MATEDSDKDFRQFQEQAEKALNLVPGLSAQNKVRAALLWNILSTQLQTIINEFATETEALEHVQGQGPEVPELGQDQDETLVLNFCNQIEKDVSELSTPSVNAVSESSTNSESGSLTLDPHILMSADKYKHSRSSTEAKVIDSACLLDDDLNALEKVVNEVMNLENEKEQAALEVDSSTSKDSPCITQTLVRPCEEFKAPTPKPSALPNLSKASSWSCMTCSQVFEDVRDYEDHVKTAHVKPKRYKCSQCPRSFSTKGNLNVHFRNHTGEKPFSCSKCCSSFTSGGNLRRHLLSHQGLKPYRCSSCGSCYTEKKNLIVHQRSHSGERPFKCLECSASFTQSGILKNHLINVHSAEKAYGCSQCGMKFKQKAQLRTHEQRHAQIKKHICTTCSASFVTNGDLSRHLKTHVGIRAFNCETCGKAFMRGQTLKEHMKRHQKS